MMLGCATPDDVIKAIKDNGVEDGRPALHRSARNVAAPLVPGRAIDVDAVDEGLGFDGSSIRGFQEIHASDMLLMPDPTTAFIDPFRRTRPSS